MIRPLDTVSLKKHNIDMSINNVQKKGNLLRGQLRTDAGLAWLIAHGPVVQDPPLEHWVLRQLVATERILRLRRGTYLVPTAEGVLPPVHVAASLLAPEGYLSFYGALTWHALTDQSAGVWAMVASKRQRSARYGEDLTIEFVAWPARLRDAAVRVHRIAGSSVRIATPVQAFVDALEAPQLAPPASELLRILRLGLVSGRLSANELRARALEMESPYLAARLGYLLEVASGKVDGRLLAVARQAHAWRPLTTGGEVADTTWRVMAPATKEQLLRSST